MDYFIAHHGIKGMKWGVKNGPPYPLSEGRKSKEEKASSARVNPGSSDFTLKKGEKIYRYSNKKESGGLKGSYTFKSKSDMNEYYQDSKNGLLGFKDYDRIYMQKISVNDDATVRRGRDTVKDIVDELGDTKLDDAYKVLDKAGYWDDSKSALDRMFIWNESEDRRSARKELGSAINKYMYDKNTSEESRKNTLSKYKKAGYDAIVDPEDFVWNYETPMILLNNKKFSREAQGVIYDHSKDYYGDSLINGELPYTDADERAINNFIKKRR